MPLVRTSAGPHALPARGRHAACRVHGCLCPQGAGAGTGCGASEQPSLPESHWLPRTKARRNEGPSSACPHCPRAVAGSTASFADLFQGKAQPAGVPGPTVLLSPGPLPNLLPFPGQLQATLPLSFYPRTGNKGMTRNDLVWLLLWLQLEGH